MPDGLALPSEPQHRVIAGDFVRANGDDSDNVQFEASLSSETPVDRGTFVEILTHNSGAVDLDRASGGLALLAEHDRTRQVGRVERIRLAGGKLRGTIRFGTSDEAKVFAADVGRGIRKELSVGYRILDGVFEESDDALPVLRVSRWEPVEVSVVSIPFDASVGVGRSLPSQTHEVRSMPEKITQAARDEAVASMLATADRHGFEKEVREFIAEGRSEQDFNNYVLEHIGERDAPKATPAADPSIAPALPDPSRYSLSRVLQAAVTKDGQLTGVELETHKELARRGALDGSYSGEGIAVPVSALVPPRTQQRAYMDSGTPAAAGNLVGGEHLGDQFIELLRNRSMVVELGARVIGGLQGVGPLSIPRQLTGATAEWVAEGSGATQSNETFDQVTLTLKSVTANVGYTRQLLLQSNPNIEQVVRDDLRSQIALAVDQAAINGSGSSNQPLGIMNTTGLGSVSLGDPNGGAPTWAKTLEMLEAVELANADMGSLAFLTNASAKKKLMSTDRGTDTGKFILEEPGDRLAGHRFAVSNQIPANLTEGSGTNLSAMIFGNWNDVLIAQWGGLEIIVDPFTESTSGRVRVTVFAHVDVAVRHAVSFAAITDMITT